MTAAAGVTGAGSDLIAGYLAELGAGLRVAPWEAELILAEAEDHLCETAAAGLAVGMTELAAQQAAISSFGPVRAVVRAHRRPAVTAGEAAMAVWKLTGLLAATVGTGGLAGLGIFAYFLRGAPGGGPLALTGPVPLAGTVRVDCSYSCFTVGAAAPPSGYPILTAQVVYAAMAAGGLALLVTRWLARRGTQVRDPLSPALTASFLLLASALLFVLVKTGVAVPVTPVGLTWTTPTSVGSVSTTPLVAGAVVAACLVGAAGFGVQAAVRRARTAPRSAARAQPRFASG